MSRPTGVNENSEVYYESHYWNNLDCTNRMINARVSGDETINWWSHFASRTGRVFDRALILNCGNGWVEREMFDGGLFKEAVGIDYSQSLLDDARSAAGDRPLSYLQANVNDDALPDGPFDLVVNHAAAHHVTRLDRVFRSICCLLPEDGWFISFRLRRTAQESVFARCVGSRLDAQPGTSRGSAPIDGLPTARPLRGGRSY